MAWAGPGVLAAATKEKMVRLLDLAADESYNLSTSKLAIGDLITPITPITLPHSPHNTHTTQYPSHNHYHPLGDILDKNDRDVDRSVTQLAFGPLDRFLAVGTAGEYPV